MALHCAPLTQSPESGGTLLPRPAQGMRAIPARQIAQPRQRAPEGVLDIEFRASLDTRRFEGRQVGNIPSDLARGGAEASRQDDRLGVPIIGVFLCRCEGGWGTSVAGRTPRSFALVSLLPSPPFGVGILTLALFAPAGFVEDRIGVAGSRLIRHGRRPSRRGRPGESVRKTVKQSY